MRKIRLLIVFAIASISVEFAQGQTKSFVFEGNNFRWMQNTDGSYFYSSEGSEQRLEVPIGEFNSPIFASAFWIGGVNEFGELKISYRRFCQSINENCFQNWGPLKINGTPATYAEIEEYNHIWFITREQIDLHQSYFDCLEDPACDQNEIYPDYEIPDDFLSWPAQSEEGSGFSEYLAPFVDRNGDEVYSATEGDYPAICGTFGTKNSSSWDHSLKSLSLINVWTNFNLI